MVKDSSRNQYLRKRNLPLARLFFSLLLDCVAENLHFSGDSSFSALHRICVNSIWWEVVCCNKITWCTGGGVVHQFWVQL